MCTLIIGRNVLGAGTVVLLANRDESPRRPSSPPRRWPVSGAPVVAGRDDRAGGTWLAVRGGEAPAASALLNRRPGPDGVPGRRTRGELPLALLASPDPIREARDRLDSGDYAPCSLVWASARECWVTALAPGGGVMRQEIPGGWHVLTHTVLDDPGEPRAARLLEQLAARGDDAAAEPEQVAQWLAGHGPPAVCLHDGPMRTVSSSWVTLSARRVQYQHREGPACAAPWQDVSTQFDDPASGGEHR